MQGWGVRPTRVIHVENDPALRGIMAMLLGERPELEVILSVESPDAALASDLVEHADVALLDLALGPHVMTGIDLGLAMRQRNADIGIVIHSQHDLTHLSRRVPENQRMGWSFVPKTGDMQIDDLVSVLRATARGMSTGPIDSVAGAPREVTAEVLDELTPRQRAVMGLLASGQSTQQIAQRIGTTNDTVRQDLSKAYRLLVPDASEGEDLRITAILAYRRLVRDEAWDEE